MRLLRRNIGPATSLVWLSAPTVAAVRTEATRSEPDETGGLLLGYRLRDGEEIVVTQIVGPGPNAQHRRLSFAPDGPWQRRELARIYLESEGEVTYLGDWHTHPSGGASPSRKDTDTARRIAKSRAARASRPAMLIVFGGSEGNWSLATHVWNGEKLTQVEERVYEVLPE